MSREAFEEANISIEPSDLKDVYVLHRIDPIDHDERIDFFLIPKKWSGEIKIMEPHKCDDLDWFPMKQLPGNIIQYVSNVIQLVDRNIFYSEFSW